MVVRCTCASGNFTASSTWQAIDPTSYLETLSNDLPGIGTTYVSSQPFTPGAITIDAILVRPSSITPTAGVTFSVRLSTGGVLVPGTEVTVNTMDLPSCSYAIVATFPQSGGEGGWIIMKFGAPVTLAAATPYTVDAKSNNSSYVRLYTDGTSGNWGRALRTTTTGAPAAGDDLIIGIEHTGPGTTTSPTVIITMDSPSTAIDYGSARTPFYQAAIGITHGCTLNFDPGMDTALKVSGHIIIYRGGKLQMGTVATPIPTGRTATLHMDCTTDGQFSVICKNGGNIFMQGSPRTPGKLVTWTKLTATVAVPATTGSVAADTGWLNGDEVFFSSTTRTYTDFDRRTLSANAGTSSIAWTGAVSFSHSGIAPTQGEVALFTRNVLLRGNPSAVSFLYVGISLSVICDLDWASFRYVGQVSGPSSGGLYLEANWDCTINVNYCSFYDTTGRAAYFGSAGTSGNPISVEDNVFHCNAGSVGACAQCSTNYGWLSFQRNFVTSPILNMSGIGWSTYVPGSIFANNVAASCGEHGWEENFGGTVFSPTSWYDNEFHSNDATGCRFVQVTGEGSVFTNVKSWRNNSNANNTEYGGGIYVNAVTSAGTITFVNPLLFGNRAGNFYLSGEGGFNIDGGIMSGDSSFATVANIYFNPNGPVAVQESHFDSVAFSKPAGGFYVAVTGTDIAWYAAGSYTAHCALYAENCWFGGSNGPIAWRPYMSTTPYKNMQDKMFFRSQFQNNIVNNNYCYTPVGTIMADTSIVHTAAPSEALLPAAAAIKLHSAPQLAAVRAGKAIQISVFVRKTISYGGNFARLILKRQDSMGINSDMVLDTATADVNVWEQLTGTTPTASKDGVFAFYVDCDGTTGQYNVDDWVAAST